MRTVSDTRYREIRTSSLCLMTFLSPKIMQFKNNVKKVVLRSQVTANDIIWRMRFACWIPKATNPVRIYNIYCFYTAIAVTRNGRNLTFIRTVQYSMCCRTQCKYSTSSLSLQPMNQRFWWSLITSLIV
jgi:hypothetical protein